MRNLHTSDKTGQRDAQELPLSGVEKTARWAQGGAEKQGFRVALAFLLAVVVHGGLFVLLQGLVFETPVSSRERRIVLLMPMRAARPQARRPRAPKRVVPPKTRPRRRAIRKRPVRRRIRRSRRRTQRVAAALRASRRTRRARRRKPRLRPKRPWRRARRRPRPRPRKRPKPRRPSGPRWKKLVWKNAEPFSQRSHRDILRKPKHPNQTGPAKKAGPKDRLARKDLRGVDLRPRLPARRAVASSRKGTRRGPKDDVAPDGTRSMGTLWPGYHKEFYAHRKAMDGLHDAFYEEVAERFRGCWGRLLPRLIKVYNRRYKRGRREFIGLQHYKGSIKLLWTPQGKLHAAQWKLPRISSPVAFLKLPTTLKRCLQNKLPPPRILGKKQLAARWDFTFTVGVPPSNDLISFTKSYILGKTIARLQVFTMAIY